MWLMAVMSEHCFTMKLMTWCGLAGAHMSGSEQMQSLGAITGFHASIEGKGGDKHAHAISPLFLLATQQTSVGPKCCRQTCVLGKEE